MKTLLLIPLLIVLASPVEAKTISVRHIIHVKTAAVRSETSGSSLPHMSAARPSDGGSSASQLDWEDMKLMAVKVARKYDIHPSVLVGMTALESGRGTSYYCRVRNNCWGIAAYDSNPDAATTFKSYQDGLEHLAIMLSGGRYSKAYAARHDPYAMIREIKAAGYATSSSYVQKITSLPEFQDYNY